LVKDGHVCHQCFDSDCQGVDEPKTRNALQKLGLLDKLSEGIFAAAELAIEAMEVDKKADITPVIELVSKATVAPQRAILITRMAALRIPGVTRKFIEREVERLRDEAEAVLGHEITHVANGDMVTLALIQGVVNTFVIFFAKLFGILVDRVLLKNDGRNGRGIGAFVAEIVAQMVLGVLASIIVMWFSRRREFRADAGGANLAGRQKMIAALERLKMNHEQAMLPEKMAAFGISGGKGVSRLFMTHPPLEERIEALRTAS
jgi:hypothetical protein